MNRAWKMFKLIERDGVNCYWCGRATDPLSRPVADLHPTIEHLKRRADGGKNGMENLVVACRKCNNSRHSLNFDPNTRSRLKEYA